MLIVTIGVDILFFIVASIILFLYVSVIKRGVSTTAHIVNVQQDYAHAYSPSNRGNLMMTYNYKYKYIVNNKEYTGTINSDASFIRYHYGDTIDVLHSKLIPTLSVTQEVANKYQTLSPSLLISPILVIVIFNIFMFMI